MRKRGYKILVPGCHGLEIDSHEKHQVIVPPPRVYHIERLIEISEQVAEILQFESGRQTTEACHSMSSPAAFGSGDLTIHKLY